MKSESLHRIMLSSADDKQIFCGDKICTKPLRFYKQNIGWQNIGEQRPT